MLSYQHSYHAGGPADVHKHAALCLLLGHLAAKEKPFTAIDLYAGEGLYNLSTTPAQKLGEFNSGISRIWPGHTSPPEMRPYMDVISKLNTDNTLSTYPGSPMFSREFLRANDTLTLNELHPSAYRTLRRWRGDDKRISLHKRDGMEALLGLVPPQIRRGLVFIDPSYEVKAEYTDIPRKLSGALNKWPQGLYALWYPILTEGRHKFLIEGMTTLTETNIFKSEILLPSAIGKEEVRTPGLLGSGIIVVNPPWQFDVAMSVVGDWLAKMMVNDSNKHTTAWLRRTESPL